MALTETKFRLVGIVVSAVFILLSVSARAEQEKEGHRCYWCGPLAEQVHRSQRASSCSGDRSKVTICDEDLPYCAIVATSPPYVESRFCVKFYQDECYSLFCNSTKTWRMTCPCRGELCNGNNTERETEAFESIRKQNVAKLTQNKRPKRGLISKAGFMSLSPRKNKIDNATEENKDIRNETVSANIVTEEDNKQEANPTDMTEVKDSQVTNTNAAENTKAMTEKPTEPETPKSDTTLIESSATTKAVLENNGSSESASAETSAESSETKNTNAMEEPAANTEKPENVMNTMSATENKDTQLSESSIQIDIPGPDIDTEDLKTDIVIMSTLAPKPVNDTKTNDMVTKLSENVSQDQTNMPETKPAIEEIKTTSEITTVMVKMTTEAGLDKAKKTSEKLPTAEALQHNDTPTTKPTEQMPSSTTTLTLNTHFDMTTQATMPRNNTAVRVDAHILTLVISVLLYL